MGALLNSCVIILLALCVHRVFRIYLITGGFTHNYPHHPGPCQQVKSIQPGSEDFEILSNGQAFISSGLRYQMLSPECQEHFRRHDIKGRIYLLDLQGNGPPSAVELSIPSTPLFEADLFAPHGMSVWEDKETGRHVLFVVNHRFQAGPVDTRVEKFVYDPDQQTLHHMATFADPSRTHAVNDVQATGEDSFYFTVCNYFLSEVGVMLEMMLELTMTGVWHYDGHSYTLLDTLKSGNGVIMSKDGKNVYVADMVARQILAYRRNQDNTLTRFQEYPVHTFPDNLLLDEKTGHLFVACHPKPSTFFFHYIVDLANRQSPSQVLQLQIKNGEITSSQEVLYDHGQLISGSSTAGLYNDTLLIGSVYDRFVTCKVHAPLFD